jgi:2-polyprenyl-6-methoxyphenol hydroxylase-like FAD-dependent oxidoreductase
MTQEKKPSPAPVLIVGAGPVGLALALDLGRRGTRCIVVDEGRKDAHVLPAKAGLLNERTLEFCRRWGIAGEVANWGCPEDYPRDTVYCTGLVGGHFVGRSALPSAQERTSTESPEILRKCPQFIFDPILAAAAEATGKVEFRRGWRFVSLEQRDESVDVQLVDVVTGETAALHAAFVVGCDGAGSAVRRALDIPFDGKTLDYSLSIITSIEHLERFHPFGKAERFMFLGPNGTWCNATAMDYRTYWRFTLLGSATPIDPAKIDARAEVVRALGSEDIPVEILGAVNWRRSQCAARTFVQGRVALAGDSAHTTSPTGGHGLNTGLGDAAGLGWMIDARVRGWGGPALFDGYDAERRPVAIRNSAASGRNYGNWVRDIDYSGVLKEGEEGDRTRSQIGASLQEALHSEWQSSGVALGYRYEGSPLIIPDGTPAPPDTESEYLPTARPGHRAPHAWLPDGRSTIDLFGDGFVMLRFGTRPPELAALTQAALARGVPFRIADIGDAAIAALYERRLVLVRPDGHVAWRGDEPPADPAALWDIVRGAAASPAQVSVPATAVHDPRPTH